MKGHLNITKSISAIKSLFVLLVIISESLSAQNCQVAVEYPSDPSCDSSVLNWANFPTTAGTYTTTTGIINSGLSVTVTKAETIRSGDGRPFRRFPDPYDTQGINDVDYIRNDYAGDFEFCFNKPTLNPIVGFVSLGTGGNEITVTTSQDFVVLYQAHNFNYDNPRQFRGNEADAIIEFPGVHQCITFTYDKAETYAEIFFGSLDSNCQPIITPRIICLGESDTLKATGATSYTWSPTTGLNTPYGASVIASPTVTTTYTVTGSDAVGGCVNTDTIRVIVNPNAAINLSSAVGTDAQSVCLNSAINPITYAVTGGGTGASVAGLPPGVSGAFAGGFFTISGTPSTVGASQYTVTTSGTCTQQTITGDITVLSAPTATVSGTTALCETVGTTDITFTGSDGTGPYTFEYTVNNGAAQTTTGASPLTVAQSTAAAGAFTYSLLSVSDASGCAQAQTGSAVVTVNGLPTATLGNDTIVCTGAVNTNVTFRGASGASPYVFTYTMNGGANQTATTTAGANTVSVSANTGAAATYTYALVSVQDANTCAQVANDVATVNVLAPLTATVTSSVPDICQGQASTWTITGGSGTAPYTFNYTIDSVNAGTTSSGTVTAVASSVSLPSPNTYADTLVMTITGLSDASGFTCPTAAPSFDTLIVNAIPSSIISAAFGDVCEGVGGVQTITFDASANPGLPTPITFNYYYTVDGGAQVPGTTTSAAGNLTATTSYTVPTNASQTIFYNSTVSSSACGGGIGGGSDTINVNPLPTATISGTASICETANTDITFTGVNGTAPFTFTYSVNGAASQTVSTTVGNSVTVNVSDVPGVYTYSLTSVSDFYNCMQTQTGSAVVTIEALPSASITAGANATICEDATATITATPVNATATSWALLSGPGSVNTGANNTTTYTGGGPATAGTSVVEITVTSDNSCGAATAVATTTVTTEALPAVSITTGNNQTICEDATATITATPVNATATSWAILSGNGTVITAGNNATTYTGGGAGTAGSATMEITVTSDNSCGTATAVATASVTTEALPSVSITAGGTQTICENATASITATPINATATSWSVLSGPGTINTAANNTTTFTAGGAGTAGVSVIEITATSDNSCGVATAVATAIITTDPLPTAATSGTPDAICVNGTQTIADASSTNGTILWTHNGAGTINNATTNAAEYVPAAADGNKTITLTMTVTSVNACASATKTATHSIVIDSLPIATITTNTTICAGGSTTLASGNAFKKYGSIAWTHDGLGAPITVNNTTPTYTSTTAEGGNTVTLTMTVAGEGACSADTARANYPITIFELPTGTVSGGTTLCMGDSAPAVTFTANKGLAPYTFNYTKNGTAANTATPPYTVQQLTDVSGDFVYTLNGITDANGCVSLPIIPSPTTTVKVNANPSGSISLSAEATCQNEAVQLIFSGSGGFGSYTFTYNLDGGANQEVSTINPNNKAVIGVNTSSPVTTATYNLVSVKDDNNCMSTSAMAQTLTVNPLPRASIEGGQTLCKDSLAQDILLTGSNGASPYYITYSIDGDNASPAQTNANDSINISVSSNTSGSIVYKLESVTDANNCSSNLNSHVTVDIIANPEASFELGANQATIIEPTVDIYESSLNAVTWSWDFSDGISSNSQDPQYHEFKDTGSYAIKLVVANSLGCADSITRTVVITSPILLYIPEAFTPNGDGINDTFLPQGEGVGEYSLSIYDRWGNLVFLSDDIEKGWDGIVNDGTEIAQIDAYVYVVEAQDLNKKTYTYRGSIKLIR